MHRCPQCNSSFDNTTRLEQHIKDTHSNLPTCPFCWIGFTNHMVLRNHIDQSHKERTLQTVHTNNTRPERKKGLCIFFSQPRGCKKGTDCDFSHEHMSQESLLKVRKFCRNGPSCSWKPGCKFIHPEDGEVMPARANRESEQGFVMPDLTTPPHGYNLASSTDFPSIQ